MDPLNIPVATSSQNPVSLTDNSLLPPVVSKAESIQPIETASVLDKNNLESQNGSLNNKLLPDNPISQPQNNINPTTPSEPPTNSGLNPTIVSGSILDKNFISSEPQAVNKDTDNSTEDSELKNLSKKRDRTMAEFVLMMDQYAPIIPDLCTDYYLTQAGFDCDDYRVKRVLALATQKFVSDIATDAYQYAKMRNQAPKDRKSGKGKKVTLTMDDLSPALSEYGINVKKPEYYL